jgi:hypothetical protein
VIVEKSRLHSNPAFCIAGATKGPDEAEPTASLKTRTPEPATLGVLALGAPGLSIWKREESVAATPEPN